MIKLIKDCISCSVLIKKLCFLSIICFNAVCFSQGIIKGTVIDSISKPLVGVHAVVLKNDSIQVAATTSNKKGELKLSKIVYGTYTVKISHLGYVPRVKYVKLTKDEATYNIGTIQLKEASLNLDEIEIVYEKPITKKRDSTIYKVSAFKTRPNEAIYDLLRKMDGIEVDDEGNIKANGKPVEQIFVNGIPLFGKNQTKEAIDILNSEMLKKVETFENRTKTARFIGIKNGDELMGLNFVLKDGAGVLFGNVGAGAGIPNRYSGYGSVGSIKDHKLWTLTGNSNNIASAGNRAGDTRVNNIKFSSGIGFKTFDLRSSYVFNENNNNNIRETTRETFTTNNKINTNTKNESTTKNSSHDIRLEYDPKLTGKQQKTLVRASMNLSISPNKSASIFNTASFNGNGNRANQGNTTNSTNGKQIGFMSNVYFTQKLGKKVHDALTGHLNISKNNGTATSNLNSQNILYNLDGTENNRLNANQQQKKGNDKLNITGGLSYTQPLKKRYGHITYDYTITNTKDNVDQDVFNRDAAGVLTPDTNLTSNYERNYWENSLNISALEVIKGLYTTVKIQFSKIDGTIPQTNNRIVKRFFNVVPNAFYTIPVSFGSLNLSYRGSINTPTLTQLNPIVNNTNPLFITKGNPDLKVAYNHNASFGYNILISRSLELNGGISALFAQNNIVNAVSIDNQFRRTSSYINVNGNNQFSKDLELILNIRPLKLKTNLTFNTSTAKSNVFINNVLEKTKTNNNGITFSIKNTKRKVYGFTINAHYNKNVVGYTTNTAFNQKYTTWGYNVYNRWSITPTFIVNSKFNQNRYSGGAFSNTTNLSIWNASISKFFMKNKLETKVALYDILNENRGISRISNLNYIQEDRYNTLGRYVMFSLNYTLGKN